MSRSRKKKHARHPNDEEIIVCPRTHKSNLDGLQWARVKRVYVNMSAKSSS